MAEIPAGLSSALAGRYELVRRLGAGGMATVYLARDLKHDRSVALKVLRPELAEAVGNDRFLREIAVVAKLDHPNIVPLFDSGEAGGHLWYTMPYVEGESLRDRLGRERQLPLDDAYAIARDVSEALGYAHSRGVVHRDVKPENILLAGGRARVADFGIARAVADGSTTLTGTGLAIGTPAYMSPEQMRGEPVDARTDIYALGCVLYEMVTGEAPHAAPSVQAIMGRRLTEPVPSCRQTRPGVPPGVDQAVARALAPLPADRFVTAQEFREAIIRGARETESAAPPSGRSWRPAAAVAVAVVLLAAAGIGLWRPAGRGPESALDPTAVAIMPFRVTGDPQAGDLGEGMVDLLAIALAGDTGVRAVTPRAVISTWRRAGGAEPQAPPDVSSRVARNLGAGLVIEGSIVATGGRLTVGGSLRRTAERRPSAESSVTGPADSLPAMVDRLVLALLARQAGLGRRLGTLQSVAALQAYLRGEAAHRRGQYDQAVRSFEDALRMDSTFALAALGLVASKPRTSDSDIDAAIALAWKHREQLEAGDVAILEAWAGPRYPAQSSQLEAFQAWEHATAAAPDQADAWFELGDRQLHFGRANDVEDAERTAVVNFGRALAIDSTFWLPLDHILVARFHLGDTTDLGRLAVLYERGRAGAQAAPFFDWRLGLALGDSALLQRARAAWPEAPTGVLGRILNTAQWQAVGLDDAEAVLGIIQARAGTSDARQRALVREVNYALNRGWPSRALEATRRLAPDVGEFATPGLRLLLDGMFADGDRGAAGEAARRLAELARRPAGDEAGRSVRAEAMCFLGIWELGRENLEEALAQRAALHGVRLTLRSRRFNADDRDYCAVLLEAGVAAMRREPGALPLLAVADSIYLYSTMHIWLTTTIVAARLRQAAGDIPGALRTIRRVPVDTEARYAATYLREQGRLAAAAGDTAAAVLAFDRYLRLRERAEPVLAQDVAQVRAELGRMTGERRR